MEKFEISKREAAREIENMRLFFNAPVAYSISERGYYYSDDSFEFPASIVTEEEIISLMIAKRLSVSIPDENRKRQIEWEIEKLKAETDDLKKIMEDDVAEIDHVIAELDEGIQRYVYEAEDSKKEMAEMQKLSSKPLISNYQYDWLEQRVGSHEEALEIWKRKHKGYKS